ncbi:CAP domain-containing protein [Candidatus Saccharibacteria bacterium]|nr:CAP domain-containing protein [Candidatus Saccharibacteria bacterium]
MKSTTKKPYARKSARPAAKKRTVHDARKRSLARRRRTSPYSHYAKPVHRPSFSLRLTRVFNQLFLPLPRNDFRPHIVRRWGLAVLALLLLVVNSGFLFLQQEQVLGESSEITAEKLLTNTNSVRVKDGLGALKISPELNRAAADKADDMLAKDYWSHTAPDGREPWDFITHESYRYILAGENLARGFNTSDGVIKAWLESPTHRANVLDKDYTEMGLAIKTGQMDGKTTTLVVAMYGRPASAPDISAPNAGRISGINTKIGMMEGSSNFWNTLRRGMTDLTPSLIFTLVALTIVAMLTIIAHFAHWKLSPRLSRTWRMHHAVIKLSFVTFLMIGAILSYGGGMI